MLTNRPKGGETYSEVWDRIKEFYVFLLKKYTNETILIVGHGGSMCFLHGLIIQYSLAESISLPKLGNTAYSIFDIDNLGNVKVVCINSSTHLK